MMKKISLLLIILFFAVAASGGYGYYTFILNEDDDEDTNESIASSGNAPVAKITPSNPKIQINEGIYFGEKKLRKKNNHILISEKIVPEKRIKWLFRIIK